MTVFSKTSYTESQQAFSDSTRADPTKHHCSEAWSILALDLKSRALYYNHLLFTTHVVFLQHVRLKPFRPVLHSLTPVPAISDLYLILRSIHLYCDPLFSVRSYYD